MTLQEIKRYDISNITSRSVKIRQKELGKTKNAVLIKKTKDSFYFQSPHTFNKKDNYSITIKKDKKDVKFHCSCEAFSKQGFQFRSTKAGCALFVEKRKDVRWSRYHGDALLCKHLYLLINSNVIKKLGI
jgi:hypothetical protein